MYFLLEMGIFHCYVSLPECISTKSASKDSEVGEHRDKDF